MQPLPPIFHLVQLLADFPVFGQCYELLGHIVELMLDINKVVNNYNQSALFNSY